MARLAAWGALLLVLSVGWLFVKSALKKQRNAKKAAALGCLPPRFLRSKNLIGNTVLRESIQATKEDRGPQFIVEKFNNVSPDCHTLCVPVLDYQLYATRDLENLKVLFTSPDFDISGTRQMSWMPLLGKGIFTSRGETWKHSRALLRPQFNKGMNNDISVEEKHINNLVRHFPADAASGWTEKVDLLPLFFKFTLDTATEFIFGRSTSSLTAGPEDADISSHFDSAKLWIDKRGALAKFYWLLNTKEFKQNCNTIHQFADSIVHDLLASAPNKSDPEKANRYNLLNEVAKTTQNPQELRNEMLHVLTAGRDTTGCLLAWTVYFLARHPDVFNKLRSTLLDSFGSSPPDYNALIKTDYLQWVINETLRFASVVPLNERSALRDTTLPRGGGPDGQAPIFIPEGTQILIPFYAVHHREDVWGPDADEFRPERWATHRPGWEFIAFGAGSRKCLGQQFARMQASYFVARFCQRYDQVENMEEGEDRLRLHQSIENRPGSGVKVRLHEA